MIKDGLDRPQALMGHQTFLPISSIYHCVRFGKMLLLAIACQKNRWINYSTLLLLSF